MMKKFANIFIGIFPVFIVILVFAISAKMCSPNNAFSADHLGPDKSARTTNIDPEKNAIEDFHTTVHTINYRRRSYF
jgi:hypothetical protein